MMYQTHSSAARTNAWQSYAISLLAMAGLSACGPDVQETPVPTPTATPAWEPPVFSGDGLPPSEGTDHATGDTSNDSGGGGDDGGGDELPPLTIVNGVFAYSVNESGEFAANTVLMSVTAGCDNIFGSVGKITPDGLYYTVYPGPVPEGSTAPDWVGTYEVCGDAPCMTGYVLVAGEYEDLESPGFLTISAYSAHYVTVDWSTPYSSGESLTFYNCGDIDIWN